MTGRRSTGFPVVAGARGGYVDAAVTSSPGAGCQESDSRNLARPRHLTSIIVMFKSLAAVYWAGAEKQLPVFYSNFILWMNVDI